MGALIEAVATSTPGGGTLDLLIPALRRMRRKSSLALADEAATRCLSRAARSSDAVELLINVGVYRDKNLGEPALASMIQEDIAANPHRGAHMGHGTFSFDVSNGGCGAINAIQIVDRFMRSAIVQRGMIVASDANPAPGLTRGFSCPPVGGAVLLSPGKDNEGFQDFYFENFPEFEHLREAVVRWEPRRSRLPFPGMGRDGKNVLTIKEAPGYLERCVDCAVESLEKFLAQRQLALAEIDLIISSQHPTEFPDLLEHRLGLPGDHVVRVAEPFVGALSASPMAGIEAARQSGRFEKAKRILFVTVGAGICVGLALYQQPG